MDHSHIAMDVDLIDQVDDEINTPIGYLKKAEVESVSFLKPKFNKYDEEFLNQIAYLNGLTSMVCDNREFSKSLMKII